MKKYQFSLLVSFIIIAISCNNATDSNSDEDTITVAAKNTEVYEYKTGISGDEEGASIIAQAKHFEISDIVRNADTRWEAVYKYKAKSGYIGTDYVEIEISTGSDGASPPTNIEIIKIKILVY